MNSLNKLGDAMKDAAYNILGKTNDLGIAAKTFFDYLTNNTPSKIDNNYLGDRYVNDYLKMLRLFLTIRVSLFSLDPIM